MEQGTGKTKVAIDTVAYQYGMGRINCLLVWCPPGLQRNWVDKEVNKHLPDHIRTRRYAWTAPPTTRRQERAIDALFTPGSELRVVAMNYEAVITEKGKRFLKRLVNGLDVAWVLDESHYCKTPGAKRTKTARAFAKHTRMRRILTGTPITQSPLDTYSQFKILDDNAIPYQRFTTFKAHFAEVEQVVLEGRGKDGKDIKFEKVVEYRNQPELEEMLAPYSFRATKDECTDLPAKTYTTRDAPLLPEQRRLYNDLLKEGAVALGADPDQDPEEALWQALMDPEADTVTAQNALSLHMRLQQVVGGYVQPDDGGPVKEVVPGKNPRMDALVAEVLDYPGKAVVWCRFRHEVEAILGRLDKALPEGQYAVAHYGGIGRDERWSNDCAFQEDAACTVWVGTPDTGGRGIDLYAASRTIYYSCSFNYEHRSQSEDRVHREGFEGQSCPYTDIVSPGTVDEKVAEALQTKDNLAKSFRWGYTEQQTKEKGT